MIGSGCIFEISSDLHICKCFSIYCSSSLTPNSLPLIGCVMLWKDKEVHWWECWGRREANGAVREPWPTNNLACSFTGTQRDSYSAFPPLRFIQCLPMKWTQFACQSHFVMESKMQSVKKEKEVVWFSQVYIFRLLRQKRTVGLELLKWFW